MRTTACFSLSFYLMATHFASAVQLVLQALQAALLVAVGQVAVEHGWKFHFVRPVIL